MPDISDEEIVYKVQKGDIESFGLLIDRFQSRLLRYGHRFLSSDDDITDLVQEVFIKVYTNIQSFNTNMKFSPWIYRIAHNEFVNRIKKSKIKPLIFFDSDEMFPHPEAQETADGESYDRELREEMDKRLREIDPKYREVLVLYYFEDMDYDEISEILHVPVSTIGVRLRRGRDQLKKIIKT